MIKSRQELFRKNKRFGGENMTGAAPADGGLSPRGEDIFGNDIIKVVEVKI
ncbi:MAG: hypothetical protein L6275_03800 [Candidatus Portnoybacteria bacterium]|nr:hypothetical protein [Candidatus Portnoybacteria bacterium]